MTDTTKEVKQVVSFVEKVPCSLGKVVTLYVGERDEMYKVGWSAEGYVDLGDMPYVRFLSKINLALLDGWIAVRCFTSPRVANVYGLGFDGIRITPLSPQQLKEILSDPADIGATYCPADKYYEASRRLV